MQQNQTQEVNIFEAVQEQFKIVDVAENMLGLKIKKVGSTYRSNSLTQDGTGENALTLYPNTNSFYDWQLQVGGDITQLVATAKFGGNISEALHLLMPDFYSKNFAEIERQLKAKKDFEHNIEFWHAQLLRQDNPIAQCARKYLADRGFTQQTIDELKIGLMEDLPFNEMRIIFPYWDMSGKHVIYFTSRKFPYHTKMENGKQVGEPFENEKSPKYKKASLEKYRFLHNAPMGLNTLYRKGFNEDGTLVITEGVFDWLAFYQEGYSVIAPNGCPDEKFWKSIMDKISSNFKRILLAFDNDDAGREFTYKAAQFLMKNHINFSCMGNGMAGIKDVAEYYQVARTVAPLVVSAMKGFDWILESLIRPIPFDELSLETQKKLMAQAKEVLTQISVEVGQYKVHEALVTLRRYFPKEWIRSFSMSFKEQAKAQEKERKKNEERAILEKVFENHLIKYDPRTGFYEYKAGKWVHQFDERIGSYVMDALGSEATWPLVSHVLSLLKHEKLINDVDLVKRFNTKPVLSFLNGTLHINPQTGEAELKKHSPDDWNTIQLPYFYNPKAKAPLWEKFIEDITGGNQASMRILQEFPGYSLLPDCRFQKCLLLKGSGANGKSVYTNILAAMFGGLDYDNRGYVSYVEPGKFKYQFSLMPLMYSLLNISSDTENDLRFAEGLFKRIIAGEVLEDSHKFKEKAAFSTRTKLLMCCNDYPSTNDTTDGFMRRFLFVELPFRYVDDPRPNSRDKKCDYNLENKLKEELPGIFNWALAGLVRLIKQGDFTKSSHESIKEFRCFNNPLYDYAEEVLVRFFNQDGTGREVHRKELFQDYVKWAMEGCIQPMASNKFYRCFQSVLNSMGITFTVKGSKRNPIWAFDNKPDSIDLKDYASEEELAEAEAHEDAMEVLQEMADVKEQEREQEYNMQFLQDPEEHEPNEDEVLLRQAL